jgi:predicted LPLAT superfamily acyltransferase
MIRMLALSAVDRGFEHRSDKTGDCEIGMCCFSVNRTALRRKSKDWLARNQNIVCEWSGMSTCKQLFNLANTMKVQLCLLV